MTIARFGIVMAAAGWLVAGPAQGSTLADVQLVAKCQKSIASAGAKFAMKTIKATLKCTNAVTTCQIQCDYGIYGPSCENSSAPCCDSDVPGSNAAFQECMDDANLECTKQDNNIVTYETQKQAKITAACSSLTADQLCGANGEGLNFGVLTAGCQALNPSWTCGLSGILSCVGGPMQRKLSDQISNLLDPRAPDAVAAVGLQNRFEGLPVTRKVNEDLPAGKRDVFALSGRAGDEIIVRVRNKDDNGNGSSNLQPQLLLLNTDMATTVANTDVRNANCPVTSVCGAQCPVFRRVLPYDGTFFLSVHAGGLSGCGAGAYRLVVVSPSGAAPMLVADDVP